MPLPGAEVLNAEAPVVPSKEESICYVVGDKFASFCPKDNFINYSALINRLDGGTACANTRRYVIGQGINQEQLATLHQRLSRLPDPQHIVIEEKISERIEAHYVHKEKPKNVLVTHPKQISAMQYAASLVIDEDCPEMMDHVTGRHIPGMLLVEAARQVCMASFIILNQSQDHQEENAFIMNKILVEYASFLFPIEVYIRVEFTGLERDKKKPLVNFKCKALFSQFDRLGCEISFEGMALPNTLLNSIEKIQMIKTCNVIRRRRH